MPEEFRQVRERVRELLAVAVSEVEHDVALERLRTIREVRRALDTFESAAMSDARAAETDWSEIGGALGMSGQAAGKRSRERHQLVDPRTDPATGRPRSRGRYRTRDDEGDVRAAAPGAVSDEHERPGRARYTAAEIDDYTLTPDDHGYQVRIAGDLLGTVRRDERGQWRGYRPHGSVVPHRRGRNTTREHAVMDLLVALDISPTDRG